MDDILSENYMPGALLMLENPKVPPSVNTTVVNSVVGDGTFDYAFETMGFHR